MGQRGRVAEIPPSTYRVIPWTIRASSETRYITPWATSSGWTTTPAGVPAVIASSTATCRFVARGECRPGGDGVDPHPARPVLRGPATGQLLVRGLGRGVHRGIRAADRGHPRTDVDDDPGATFGHRRGQLGDEDVRSPDVDREHRVEVGVGELLGQGRRVDAGIVDQDVDAAAEGGRGLSGERAQVGVGPGQVGRNEHRCAAGAGDRVDERLAAVTVAATDHHGRALGGQGAGDGRADAAGGAGDDRRATRQAGVAGGRGGGRRR